jgi:hypothetical protein
MPKVEPNVGCMQCKKAAVFAVSYFTAVIFSFFLSISPLQLLVFLSLSLSLLITSFNLHLQCGHLEFKK